MTRKQIMAETRHDPEMRAALLAVRNARAGQKERRKRDLILLAASRLSNEGGGGTGSLRSHPSPSGNQERV